MAAMQSNADTPVSCSLLLMAKHLPKKRADAETKNGSDAESSMEKIAPIQKGKMAAM